MSDARRGEGWRGWALEVGGAAYGRDLTGGRVCGRTGRGQVLGWVCLLGVVFLPLLIAGWEIEAGEEWVS